LKVLVTGATGYLGVVAAAALAAREHQVVGLETHRPVGQQSPWDASELFIGVEMLCQLPRIREIGALGRHS
jgi:nucleoside-diphosphate-sugar epimerase